MAMARETGDSAWDTLTAYGQVVRRRIWVVLGVAIVIPLVAVFVSKLEDPVFEASANVLVSRENVAATLAGVPDTLVNSDPVRFMQTQAGRPGGARSHESVEHHRPGTPRRIERAGRA
jgi:uncharacterized protein involved in exopolysaccharide biosynthesis